MTSPDVLIVGSGVAGALIAAELAAAGAQVTILEAGDPVSRDARLAAFTADPDADPWPAAARGQYVQAGPDPYDCRYLHAVGGTTWAWAGIIWRFQPNDFRLKSLYGVGRDWPLSYDDLAPWYAKAETALGMPAGFPPDPDAPAGAWGFSWNDKVIAKAARAAGLTALPQPAARNFEPWQGRPACCAAGGCDRICPTGAQYSADHHIAKAEQAGARLIPSARVFKLETGPNNHIAAVHYLDASGTAQRLAAARFVLAAGGLETPRLLLMSNVANRSGQVGANLMDHPGIGFSCIAKDELWPGRGPVEISAITSHLDGDFRRTAAAAKINIGNRANLQVAVRSAIADGYAGSGLDAEIRRRATRLVALHSFHEDIPAPARRVTLSPDKKDAHGRPLAQVHYQISDYVKAGAVRTRAAMRALAREMGGASAAFDPAFVTHSHPMGTTVMGADPATSVTDPSARAHDHPNLYIAGSSLFPSATALNPTLTIAALALRLADELKR